MPTENLLRLLLLLMFVIRIVFLLQIWKLRFGHKASVQTLSTLVKILKFSLGQHSEARFGLDFNSSFS